MRALSLAGKPVEVMRTMTWWQVLYAAQAQAGPEPEPEATLNPIALRKYGVGVRVTNQAGH